MIIHYETLKNRQIAKIEQEYTVKDTILYAMALSLGVWGTAAFRIREVKRDVAVINNACADFAT